MERFELVFFQKSNGNCPVVDFMTSLNPVMASKMAHQLDLLEMFGNRPKGDFSKFVQDGIFEIRAQNRTDISRILYFFDKNRRVVLTNGFIKKSQRLPAAELELAKKYRADYLSREHENAADRKKTGEKEQGAASNSSWTSSFEEIIASGKERSEKSGNNTKQKKDMLR